jgi:hypothetical protein
MNSQQKTVLLVATAVLLAMIAFPPWTFVYQPSRDSRYSKGTRPAGYHSLIESHVPQDQTQLAQLFGLPVNPYASGLSHFSMEIDSSRLTLQIGGLVVITALIVYVSRKN